MSKPLALVLLALAVLMVAPAQAEASAPEPTIGSPVFVNTRLGHTYQSLPLPNAQSCPAMMIYYGHCRYHPYPAVDFMVPQGTAVRAVADGVVVLADQEHEGDGDPDGCDPSERTETAYCRRPGMFVVVEHTAEGLPPLTTYKHLMSTRMTAGTTVTRGQIIGRSGNTQSPDFHLHFDAQSSLACLNTYACQVDYGRMTFCNPLGQTVRRSSATLLQGQAIRPRPCPRPASALHPHP